MADDTNAFNNPAAVAAPATAAPKAKSNPAGPVGSPGWGKPGQRAAGPRSAPATPKHNPNTAANGVPRITGQGQKQLDGRRTPEMSKPVRKGGLAERQSSPVSGAGSADRTSGLEAAMAREADRLHPRSRPKATRRK